MVALFVDANATDFVSQLRAEWLHLAFLAVFGGIWFYYRRDIVHGDEDKKNLGAEVRELGRKMDIIKEKHGYEINDTRRAVDRLYERAELEPPVYPSR